MELLKNLFEGYPDLWGGGVAHSVLILSLVIAFGIMLAKIKVAGVSLGITWILFVGIVFGHFDMTLNEHLLHFMKEFGLILFVYSIGLQVGPGFFSAFKKGGLTLNLLAMLVVFLGVVITIILHFVTGTPITTMVGILSGAVTNTPGLGAAQQANSDLNGIDAPEIALGYAVAYLLGVVGIILSLIALKYILRINTKTEEAEAERGLGHIQELTVRPISFEIRNEAIDGKKIKDIRPLMNRDFVISRVQYHDGQGTELANSDTVLHLNDKILVISTPKDIEAISVFFGKQIDMQWEQLDKKLISRRILITKPELNGKMLSQLKIRNNFGASITRVISLFLACVGLGAGKGFVETVIYDGGYVWVGYGVIITIVPLLIAGLVGRYVFKLNYYTLIGVLGGSTTNPPALAYSNDLTSCDAPAVGYATVYPLTMFLRVLTAQILILALA